ncbi:Uncharacterised protein [Mycobacteroides abscessus subsp. abscessus]|uniref:hypothetical protein n=1 Tax=Mycobacteroides abscessus TaxID=36809 RepID=UPI0009A783AF|nr:hypothetical protein [Mycobacteroides abscessus]MBN7388558.1 hypothetical protein [Mycobacteroides abscessus subsp. abscessus]MBN7414828.1 hypothetical protein [Mycobacteroides abscessus subsp. abscessus]MDO2961020.1 hypothetical protein [Mycobacteroides abscessus subsp. abscessus]MDO2994988.1 hypothetical protein [Mycobacteroides abscessus subsp. abscessus]MDO3064359.1 hypothetical protein [Mycobacteroides abscessus subsp. abscessus]
MPTDPYPDLPALPRAVQLACASIEPEHLLLPPADLCVVVEVSQAIRRFVDHCTPHLGSETVDMTTYQAILAVQRVVEQALNNSGDVTPSD